MYLEMEFTPAALNFSKKYKKSNQKHISLDTYIIATGMSKKEKLIFIM
jgi:hypothetical protein